MPTVPSQYDETDSGYHQCCREEIFRVRLEDPSVPERASEKSAAAPPVNAASKRNTETGRLTLGVSRTACSISSLSLPSVSYNMSISREEHLPVQDCPKKNGQCLPSLLNSVLASATKRIQDMTSILKTSSGIQDVFKLSCTSKVRSFFSWGNYLPCLPISPDPFVRGMAFFP